MSSPGTGNRTGLGVIGMLDGFPAARAVKFAQAVEELGYDTLWLPELFGREPFAAAGYLLARTERIEIASGIANLYARDPHATIQAGHTLNEFSGGRFVLGVGVSNVGLNTMRGHTWRAPMDKAGEFFARVATIKVDGAAAAGAPHIVLAAHGPQLQRLGARHGAGLITYLMMPEHTRRSRARVGADVELNVTCMMLAETDPDRARRTARKALAFYMGLDYYHREWRELGFTDADFANGGSDALIDALVGWGDADALRARIAAHREAGATNVVVVSLDPGEGLPLATLRAVRAAI